MARDFRNTSTCVLLFKALVRSHLDYATVIWNRNRAYTTEKLERIQNSFQRWICFKFPRLTHLDSVTLRQSLDLPSISSRLLANDLLFFYGCLHGRDGQPASVSLRLPRAELRNYNNFVAARKSEVTPELRCTATAIRFQERIDFFRHDYIGFKRRIKELCWD